MLCWSSSVVSNRSVVVDGQSRSRSIPRIHGPKDLKDDFIRGNLNEERMPLVAKIESIYRRLKHQELGHGGLCFGLLDPTSNIYVNSFMSPDVAARDREAATARGGDEAADDDMMIQRSLDGLLAFLTRLFPYLPSAEALRYLDAAGAHPLLAALLVMNRRGIERSFSADSDATRAAVEAALRCAAVAARHPDPHKLVLGWKLVSFSPDLMTKLLIMPSRLESSFAELRVRLDKMADPATPHLLLQLDRPWELAKSRPLPPRRARSKALPLSRAARKRVLIATIHGFYLQALARLPRNELCARYHHSLLNAGHCYGPLDPVSNIIVNTVWYDRAFPPSKQVTLRMISTRCLRQIVARSLYGLVSFMRTRYPDRTPDQVLQCLLEAKADLRVADPAVGEMLKNVIRTRTDIIIGRPSCFSAANLLRQVVTSFRGLGANGAARGCSLLASLQAAYAAAATAARHPVPLEQQSLLAGSPYSLLKLEVARMQVLYKDCLLSSDKVKLLTGILVCPSAEESRQQLQPEPKVVGNAMYALVSHKSTKFWHQHDRVTMKVKAALAAFNINRVQKYRLHFICGVNELVSGPDCNTTIGYDPRTPYRFHHSHVNFLATCEGPRSDHAPATLFFAECGNYCIDKETWCCPVNPLDQDTEHVRCIYCELSGTTIVHPAMKDFHGCNTEFEKVLRGELLFSGSNKSTYTNDSLYLMNAPDQLNGLGDDCIYSDYARDPNDKISAEKLLSLFLR